ncbi:hypothetical protein Btru_067471 [Bulinus truncatus]|nr:hypothetical protein Btru_067471 [Bulinus truncatus]
MPNNIYLIFCVYRRQPVLLYTSNIGTPDFTRPALSMEEHVIKLFHQYRANEFWQPSGWARMVDKKSILSRLPGAESNIEQSDIMFRFNRVPPGDKGEGQGQILEQENSEKEYVKTRDIQKKIIPGEGELIPPPTAAEVLKEKKKISSSVDYCAPVEYQMLPPETNDTQAK